MAIALSKQGNTAYNQPVQRTKGATALPVFKLGDSIAALRRITGSFAADRRAVTRARLNPSCRARVVLEIRRGRRLVTMDPQNLQAVCELMTPTLTAIEWALKPEKLELPDAALAKMQEMVDTPAEPNARLRAAVKRRRR